MHNEFYVIMEGTEKYLDTPEAIGLDCIELEKYYNCNTFYYLVS